MELVFTFSNGTYAYNAIIFSVDNPEHNNIVAIGKGNVKYNNQANAVSAPYGKTNISRIKDSAVLSIQYNRKNNRLYSKRFRNKQ